MPDKRGMCPPIPRNYGLVRPCLSRPVEYAMPVSFERRRFSTVRRGVSPLRRNRMPSASIRLIVLMSLMTLMQNAWIWGYRSRTASQRYNPAAWLSIFPANPGPGSSMISIVTRSTCLCARTANASLTFAAFRTTCPSNNRASSSGSRNPCSSSTSRTVFTLKVSSLPLEAPY